jgi:hypothetical protein
MKRLYYLTSSLSVVDKLNAELNRVGLLHSDIHVVSNDEKEVKKHHLIAANKLEKSSVLDAGFLGLLIGLSAGIVCYGAIMLTMLTMQVSPSVIQLTVFSLLLGGMLLGGGCGVAYGYGHDSRRLNAIRSNLSAGDHLMMIDAEEDREPAIKDRVRRFHLSTIGEDRVVAGMPFSMA